MFRSSGRGRQLVVVAAATTALVATGLPALAAISPAPSEPGPAPVTAQPATLSSTASSQWQTNNAVWALAVSNGKLYAGGDFTSVRPPAASAGTGEVARTRLAAFSSTTGELDTTFKHSADGRVLATAVSPDGRTLYVGGNFVYADGVSRKRIAAFDLTKPGQPLLPWAPAVTGDVRAITVSPDSGTVFVGGSFTNVSGTARNNLVAVSASTGTLLPSFAPAVNGPVSALLVAPGGQQLILGGNFETVNGSHHRAIGSVQIANGASAPMDDVITSSGCGVPTCSPRSDIKALVSDGTLVYAASEGTGGGWFDGTLAVNPQTGHQVWKNTCLGATQAIAVVNGVLYDGSHAHDCTTMNAFGQAPFQNGPSSWHHLMGLRADTGKVLDWFPTTNPGPTEATTDKLELGPRAMATDGTNLFVGGHFTRVNGAGQQGIARFAAGTPTAKPVAVTNGMAALGANGTAVLRFPGTTDPDSGQMTYKIYRDGNYSAPVGVIGPVWAHWWSQSLQTFRDSGLTAGSHYYVVDAVDESGNTTRSGKFTASATGVGYANAVKASAPTTYWRLDETAGTTAADSSGRNLNGTYSGSLNLNQPGAIPSGRAIHLGSTGSVAQNTSAPAPTTYAVSAWIRTTTTTGGRILGYGDRASGSSANYDRMLWMDNAGQLLFGVYAVDPATKKAGVQYVWTPKSYNDGTWHQVVISQDGTYGLRLFVDGYQVAFKNSIKTAQAYNGYWRIGNDNTSGWPQRGSSSGFNGDVDEFVVYSSVPAGSTQRAQMTAE